MNEELRRKFRNPPGDFRPVAFWFLNDELNEKDIEEQLLELRDKKINQVITHPRSGMEVEYLSSLFWEKMRFIMKKIKELGMKAWIYDDYNWPSGTAGGVLIRDHPELKMRYLHCSHLKDMEDREIEIKLEGDFICARAVERGKGKVIDVARSGSGNIVKWRAPSRNWEFLVFTVRLSNELRESATSAPWSNNEGGYLDVLDEEAVEKFIQYTHQRYYEELKAYFGETILGFFTDEPAIFYEFYATNLMAYPWTRGFLDKFQKVKGYDFKERLHELVAESGDWVKTRADYWDMMVKLFSQSYHRQIKNWCKKHGVKYIGHMQCEEDPSMSIMAEGGGFYEYFKHFDIPGIDELLGETGYESVVLADGQCEEQAKRNIGVKLISSLAHLLGKKRILCESWGGSGWYLPMSNLKKMVNWLEALGVNLIIPHGVYLSIKGLRKRDYPPSHYRQQPWWEYYGTFSDYVARLGLMSSEGIHRCQLGVLYPLSGLRTQFYPRGLGNPHPGVSSMMEEVLAKLTEFLLRNQRDFDYLFEEAFEDKAEVKNGKLHMGAECFTALIIPPTTTLPVKTLKYLEDFYNSGGVIIALEILPVHSIEKENDRQVMDTMRKVFGIDPGLILKKFISEKTATAKKKLTRQENNSGGISVFMQGFLREEQGLEKVLSRYLSPDLRIEGKGSKNFTCSHRTSSREEIYFLANLSEKKENVRVTIPTTLVPEIWNPAAGSIDAELSYQSKKKEVTIPLCFHGYEGLFIIFDKGKKEGQPRKPRAGGGRKLELELSPVWSLKLEKPNNHLLDNWMVKVDYDHKGEREKWFSRDYDDKKWTRATTTRYRCHLLGEDPCKGLPRELLKKPSLDFWMRGKVFFEYIPDEIGLVLEDVGVQDIYVNGAKITGRPERYFLWDKDNLEVPLEGLIKKGENIFAVKARMPDWPALARGICHGIEPIALKGDFSVQSDRIYPPSKKIKNGSWTEQGLVNYVGGVVYEQECRIPDDLIGKRFFLVAEKVKETMEVYVNDESQGVCLWEPYTVEITSAVRPRKNRIALRVTNTMENLLGEPRETGLLGDVKIVAFD